ncbi:hypothetical protein KDA_66850 [Dictyobacter alpinus]|uniref:Uncharacterized protein n=2 Tax=Dictyobacter alpinus TaxID=2014873 RepID=A0A402BIG5_9CHLR|nr:hypothetical protein KDA_66850 [Dictyobacter alpinus]
MYWWPLIFEAMHKSLLRFPVPQRNDHKGVYFSTTEGDDIYCSFRDLWSTIYDDHDDVLVSFWLPNSAFYVQVSLAQNNDFWQLDITLDEGMFNADSIDDTKLLLNTFINCSINLYAICNPIQVRLYWDEDISTFPKQLNLLQMTNSLEEAQSQILSFRDQQLHWREVALIYNTKLSVLDPFPLWEGNSWGFISLP